MQNNFSWQDSQVIPNIKFIRPRKKSRKRFYFLLVFCIGIIGWYVISHQYIKTTITAKPSLQEVVENSLTGVRGTYAINIKNLKTKETYTKDDHRIFEVGSLYKLWIMAVVFQQIENGQLQEDQVLQEDVATLNQIFNIDPDDAELSEGVVTLTVADALKQMITISHNYAALLLTEKIKLSTVANFLQQNGLLESSVGTDGQTPKSTPADISLFLEKLYNKQLANEENTNKMIDLLARQQLNDGLPKYLEGIKVAHKTGDIGWFKHDGGIIFTPQGDYIIVVMSESDYPSGAQERIAQVSKSVFDYFTKE